MLVRNGRPHSGSPGRTKKCGKIIFGKKMRLNDVRNSMFLILEVERLWYRSSPPAFSVPRVSVSLDAEAFL